MLSAQLKMSEVSGLHEPACYCSDAVLALLELVQPAM